jgi:RimJ/RimL family protein N-acetyltransferase
MSLTPSAMIEGRAIRLRALAARDIEHSLAWRNDPAIRDAQLGYPFPVTVEMEERWYSDALSGERRDRVCFAVETKEGALAGFVHLTGIDWISRVAGFGITIGSKQLQGRGIGTEATECVVRYGFETLNLERIWLEAPASNERAIRLYEQVGFRREGVLRGHAYAAGRRQDVVVMGMLRGEAKGGPEARAQPGKAVP